MLVLRGFIDVLSKRAMPFLLFIPLRFGVKVRFIIFLKVWVRIRVIGFFFFFVSTPFYVTKLLTVPLFSS